MEPLPFAVGLPVAGTNLLTTEARAAALDTVRWRGLPACGVSASFPEPSTPIGQGAYRGLDVDHRRAIAAAVLGDATKVRFVPLTARNHTHQERTLA